MRHFIGVPKVGPPRRRFVGEIAVSIMRGPKSPYDPSSNQIFGSFTTPPTTARKAIIDQCVLALKSAGIWSKLDALYLFAAADSQAALVNWKQPGIYNSTAVNVPVFTVDRGFTGANTRYLDTTFNPTTAISPLFTQNSASLIAFSNSAAFVQDRNVIGDNTGGINGILPKAFNSNNYTNINSGSVVVSLAAVDGSGLFAGSRSASTLTESYRNGALIGTIATASTPSFNGNFHFLQSSNNGWVGQCAAGGFGASLSGFDNYLLYEALANYMAAVQGGTIMSPEAVALFDAMGGKPDIARRIRINDCINSLKSSGVWTKLDALYLFAALSSQNAKINWRNPGTYNATEVNTPTFVADAGYTGGGTAHLSTTFDIGATSTPVPKYTINNASAFALSASDIASPGPIIGETNGRLKITPRHVDDWTYSYINTNVGELSILNPNSSGLGLYSLARSGAASQEIYKNGALLTSNTAASLALPATVFFMRNSGVYWAGRTAAGGVGAYLNATEQLALHEALLAYQVGIATDAIAASFTTPPAAARKSLIQTCVSDLMRAGVWNKLDALYVLAAADSQAAKINWVQPGTYNAAEVGAPTFTANQGFTAASGKIIGSGFNPATAITPKFVQNSACMFAYTQTNDPGPGGLFGDNNGGSIVLAPRFPTDVLLARVNTLAGNISTASTNTVGFWSATRSGASASEAFKNGASVATSAAASAAVVNGTLYFGIGGGNYWTGQMACGGFGQHLNSTEQLALYNAINTYLLGVGAVSYQAETNAIAAAFTTPPTTARKNLIDACVVSLKSAGVWAKLDALYAFAAADSQAAKINWKAPGTYNCSEVNAPTFTADQGFTGASTKYLSSGFNALTAPTPKYTQNDASISGWSLTSAQVSTGGIMGYAVASNVVTIWPRNASNQTLYAVNSAGLTSPASTDGSGLWAASRTSSSSAGLYRNGASVNTDATASGSPANAAIAFLTRYGEAWPGQCAGGTLGSQLSAGEQTALYNALRTYMTGVGVP